MKTARYYTLAVVFTVLSFSISGQTSANEVPKANKLYKEILKTNDVALCNLYISAYPNGSKVESVEGIIEKQEFIVAYSIAVEKFSDTALRSYVKRYPNGVYTQQANDAIEVSAWQNAYSKNTMDSYKEYLNEYPEGKAVKLAKERIEELE